MSWLRGWREPESTCSRWIIAATEKAAEHRTKIFLRTSLRKSWRRNGLATSTRRSAIWRDAGHCWCGRRELRRQPVDSTGAAASGSEVAGAVVRQYRSRRAEAPAEVGKASDDAFRGRRRWRGGGSDALAV